MVWFCKPPSTNDLHIIELSVLYFSSEQQSLTQAQLFLELTKLFNVKISVVKTEESNVVSHSNNPNNSTREDKPLTAPTSAQVPTFTPPAHSSDIDVKQKETKQKNKKQKGKLNQPVSEKNIVRTTCDATAAADSGQGLRHAPCSDQQEVSTGESSKVAQYVHRVYQGCIATKTTFVCVGRNM